MEYWKDFLIVFGLIFLVYAKINTKKYENHIKNVEQEIKKFLRITDAKVYVVYQSLKQSQPLIQRLNDSGYLVEICGQPVDKASRIVFILPSQQPLAERYYKVDSRFRLKKDS